MAHAHVVLHMEWKEVGRWKTIFLHPWQPHWLWRQHLPAIVRVASSVALAKFGAVFFATSRSRVANMSSCASCPLNIARSCCHLRWNHYRATKWRGCDMHMLSEYFHLGFMRVWAFIEVALVWALKSKLAHLSIALLYPLGLDRCGSMMD